MGCKMFNKHVGNLNRILLGLVMLVPGIMKLFDMGSSKIVEMLSNMVLFSWAPSFWAWVLILSEIVFGIAILFKWRLQYTSWPPVVILVIASFTVHWANWGNMLVHLTLASNYYMLGVNHMKSSK
jgi:uncharacterized membrane protein YphA (DoxX/SURF4 family)